MAALVIQMHSETPRRAPSLKLTLAPKLQRRSMAQATSSGVSKWIIHFTSPQWAENIIHEIPPRVLGGISLAK